MDLEYWIDYVYLFGVGDFIPLYDKLDFITFRNWDVYAIYFAVLFVFGYASCSCFSLVFGKRGKKVKQD